LDVVTSNSIFDCGLRSEATRRQIGEKEKSFLETDAFVQIFGENQQLEP
jgi:hypothetical protein